jgi:hypothetical protein
MIGYHLLSPEARDGRWNAVRTLEPVVDQSIRIVGSGLEIFGVLIIVIGIAWSTYR